MQQETPQPLAQRLLAVVTDGHSSFKCLDETLCLAVRGRVVWRTADVFDAVHLTGGEFL